MSNDLYRTYLNHKAVLDAALAAGGGRYSLPSHKEAVRWRLEAYYFRKLYVKKMREEIPVGTISTPYDNMLLRLAGNVVIIEQRVITGKLTTHDGTVITLDDPYRREQEKLDEEAEQIAKDLGLDLNG